jgi:hypothetical protein
MIVLPSCREAHASLFQNSNKADCLDRASEGKIENPKMKKQDPVVSEHPMH